MFRQEKSIGYSTQTIEDQGSSLGQSDFSQIYRYILHTQNAKKLMEDELTDVAHDLAKVF